MYLKESDTINRKHTPPPPPPETKKKKKENTYATITTKTQILFPILNIKGQIESCVHVCYTIPCLERELVIHGKHYFSSSITATV